MQSHCAPITPSYVKAIIPLILTDHPAGIRRPWLCPRAWSSHGSGDWGLPLAGLGWWGRYT